MDSILSKNPKFKIENGVLKGEEIAVDVGDADVGREMFQTLMNNPNFVGQVDAVTGEECTFKRMADESVRCSLWMRKEGMKLGDAVVVFTHNHLATYIPCLATLFNRGIICPSFSGHSVENLEYITELIKPKFIFADEREAILIDKMLKKKENNDIKIITFEKIEGFISIFDVLDGHNSEEIDNFSCTKPNSPEDNCILIFTSGASGEPKPTLHLYGSVMHTILMCRLIKNRECQVALNSSPLGWVTGIVNTILDIVMFIKKIIIHEKGHEPEEILRFIEKYKVSNLILAFDMIYKCHMVKNWRDYDLTSIKRMSIGGAKLNPNVFEFFQEIFPNGQLQIAYGSTELLLIGFKTVINRENFDSCGFIIPGVQVKVINPQNGETLRANEIGELCFKTPFMFREYYKNPEATKSSIDENGWFHSKDCGYYDEKGYGYIASRKSNLSLDDEKNQIHWEIERILLLNSSVVEVATISDTKNSKIRIFAFVTIIPNAKVTEEELVDILKFLSLKECQVTVKILENMPLTYSGKIKINVLKTMTESM